MESTVVHHTDWMFYVLLMMSAMLVYARAVYPRRFMQLSSIKRQMINPMDPSYERSANGAFEWILTINYGLSMAMMIFVILQNVFTPSAISSGGVMYAQLVLAVSMYLVVRNLVIRIAAHLFSVEKTADWWMEYLHFYRVGLGIWLPLLLFFVVFSDAISSLILVVCVIYIVFFLLKMIITAAAQIRSRGSVGLFRILLYLCALEIAPLIWLLFWVFG